MNPRRLRWITVLAATGAITGGASTLVRLPAPAAPSPTIGVPSISTDPLQRSLAAEAARLQHQVAVETARLVAESAQLAQRRAALAQESAAAQQSRAAAPSTAVGVPVTHATTGASATSTDAGASDN
jgi:hypothetical protein